MKMPTLPEIPSKPKEPKSSAKSKSKSKRAEKKIAKVEQPEDSVGLRVVSCGIAVLCIGTASLYVGTTPMLVFLYLWGALTGSYVSFVFRHQKTFWLTFITSVGLLLVLGNFFEEVTRQFNAGKIDALIPFIHVLTGLLSLHTFDLRAKSDINVSALIGLGLFACTAVIARDMTFAYITLTYITLVAGLLYYEAVSRTQAAGAMGISSEREEINLFKETAVRKHVSLGNASMTLLLLPLISILIFLCLPRVDSLFDLMVANIKKARNGEQLSFNWVKSENGWSLLSSMQTPGDAGKGPGQGGSSNDVTIGGDQSEQNKGGGNGPGTGPGGKGSGNDPGIGPGGKEVKPGAGPGGTGSNPDALNLTDGSPSSSNGKGKGKGTKGSGVGGTEVGKPGDKGKPVKSGKGKDSGKPGKGGKDAKDEKGEKTPEPALQPVEMERTAEQEDQTLVFRNKESVEHEDDLIMRVMSSRETYYKRVCFDKYDGQKWSISSLGKVAKCSKHNSAVQELAGVPSLYVEPGVHSSLLTQDVTIEANIGHIIPAAAIPQQLSYPKDPIFVDQFGVMRTKDPIKGGVNYRVVSQVADYDLDEMRKSDAKLKTDIATMQNYLQLPANLNPQVAKLAKSVAGSDGNWFVKAERICNYLRRNYKYSDDLSDKSKEEIAFHFLCRTKQGACGPFSTAFVIMCRAVGIPARCIGGFSPGDFNNTTGIHEIKNKHGHAWGEVYVPGYEWVPFDPTPTGLLPKPTPEDTSMMGSFQKTFAQLHDQFMHQNPAPPPLPPEEAAPDKATGNQQQSANGQSGGKETGTPGVTGTGTKNTSKENVEAAKGEKKAADNTKLSKSSQSKSQTTKAVTPPKKEEPKQVPFNFNWRDWHEDVLLIIVIPAVIMLFQAIYTAIQQARKARKAKVLEKPKASTMLYLKVVDDLAKVKIHRLPTDTPDDLMSRFVDHTMYEHGVKLKFHPELEPVCKQFMDLYIADRFGCDDASEMRAGQMKNLSEQIHTLVRTKQHDN